MLGCYNFLEGCCWFAHMSVCITQRWKSGEVRAMICLRVWFQGILEGSTLLWFLRLLFGWVEAEREGLYVFSWKETQIMPFHSLRSTLHLENGPLKPAHIRTYRTGLGKNCHLFLCCLSWFVFFLFFWLEHTAVWDVKGMSLIPGRASWFVAEKKETKTIPGQTWWTSLNQLQ